METPAVPTSAAPLPAENIQIGQITAVLKQGWMKVLAGALAGGLVGALLGLVLPATYTSKTVILPPQAQGSVSAQALGALGTLTGLAAGAAKGSPEQYVALMTSVTVGNKIADQFNLQEVYGERYRSDALKELAKRTAIVSNKKDGLISVEVEDRDPARAAEIATAYVSELRAITASLALTEAQHRRLFFETRMQEANAQLARAQKALEASGFGPGALKADPKNSAERYARLKAQQTATRATLETLQTRLAPNAPEVREQRASLVVIDTELKSLEATAPNPTGSDRDYISRYRDFKYQEVLFDLFARQYEAARVEESKDGMLIQVVDIATPAEKKSRPKLSLLLAGGVVLGLLTAALWVLRAGARPRQATGA